MVAFASVKVRVLLVELVLVKCVEVIKVELDFLVVETALFLLLLELELIWAVVDLMVCRGSIDFCVTVVLYLVLVPLSVGLLSELGL